MKIDISELLKNVGNELNIEEEASLNFKDDGLLLSGPVAIKISLINAGETVLLKGRISTRSRLSCCRCLKEFDFPIDIEIEEEYSKKTVSNRRVSTNNEVELKEEDFIFPISEDNKIDLTEGIRQNIFTSLPIKPLCNKTCKGLNGKVQKKRSADPRLSNLKEIKGKIQGGDHGST